MSKHTKGPWHIEVDYPCSYNGEGATGRCAIFDRPDGCIIATTQGDVSEIRKSESANAHLIAAAPEMLEALKYARRFLRSQDVDTAFVDAAIAKAEGRQP